MIKKSMIISLVAAAALTTVGCSKGTSAAKSSGVDKLVSEYGFQWQDTSKPILNKKGAEELSFNIYSSKNASALDYNDMLVMQNLFESTGVNVNWENVSESVYTQQKNLIFGDANNRPDAIYHAGMSAGEIIKYAKRKVLVPISDYLEYMPNFKAILDSRPDIKNQLINVEDGKIYSLPRIEEMGLLQNPNLLFLNKAWTVKAIKDGVLAPASKNMLAEDVYYSDEYEVDVTKCMVTAVKSDIRSFCLEKEKSKKIVTEYFASLTPGDKLWFEQLFANVVYDGKDETFSGEDYDW